MEWPCLRLTKAHFLLSLKGCLKAPGVFSPGGHLAMSGAVTPVTTWRECVPGIWWVDGRDAADTGQRAVWLQASMRLRGTNPGTDRDRRGSGKCHNTLLCQEKNLENILVLINVANFNSLQESALGVWKQLSHMFALQTWRLVVYSSGPCKES